MISEKMQKAMDTIQDFYFGDSEDCGEVMFKKFAEKHSKTFKKGKDQPPDEHKLEYTQVYNEFQDVFEKKIEELIEKAECSQEEFVSAITEKSKSDQEIKMFLEILTSVSDYTTFIEMMEDYVDDIENPDSDDE